MRVEELIQRYRAPLLQSGWRESTQPFWKDENPCFYDLSRTKTVLLFRDEAGNVDDGHYFWMSESQEIPGFISPQDVVVRRYKLHHSMNALLWHDYGDRKIVH